MPHLPTHHNIESEFYSDPERATDSPTEHVTPPKQDRSRRTLERIVAASLEILEERGPDGLTVQAIVKRARSSVGSFYARFGGKEDLLDYLGARVWEEATSRWDAALAARDWSGLSLAELAEGSVRLLAEAHRSRASFLKALDRMGGAGDEAYEGFRAHLLDGLAVMILERRTELAHPDPELAVRVGLRAVLGVLDTPTGGDGPLDADTLVREARALLLGYLTGVDAGASAEDGDVDFFDIWG